MNNKINRFLFCTSFPASDAGAAYDTNVKYLLADKQILSRILKYTVDEFREMDTEDILGCIGDDIEIGARPVDAGLSNLGRVKSARFEISLQLFRKNDPFHL